MLAAAGGHTVGGVAPSARAIAAEFGLGVSVDPLAPVAGGFVHRMWRLETDGATFAVKELRFPPADRNAWLEEYQSVLAFEAAAYRAGIAMPEPIIAVDGRLVVEVEDEET